jgi:hypothetical protein
MTVGNSTGSGQTVAISITNVSPASPAQFFQTNTCPATLPSGGSCTVSVTFGPTATGPKTGTMNVNVTGGGGNHNISLTGTGT